MDHCDCLCLLSGHDGFGEVMRPSPSLPQGSIAAGLVNQPSTQQDRLIQSDLDGSLALIAGNLSIRPDGQMKKYDICNLCLYLCEKYYIWHISLF